MEVNKGSGFGFTAKTFSIVKFLPRNRLPTPSRRNEYALILGEHRPLVNKAKSWRVGLLYPGDVRDILGKFQTAVLLSLFVHVQRLGEIFMLLTLRSLAMFMAISVASFSQFVSANAAEPTETEAKAAREKIEKQFMDSLTGATLVGHYTIVTKDQEKGSPKEEKYSIESVTKLKDDVFIFKARIQYGEHDVTVPLPLPVSFAGDTPMIVLNKFLVPGLGTFSARVIFHEGKYAGTWDGGDHGGHLYGRIVKAKAEEKK